MHEIRASVSPGETRTALLRDGEAVEFAVERGGLSTGVGALHLARVSAVAPAMSGAFLTLAGEVTGFLPESEAPGRPIAKSVQEGMAIAVRVTRAPQGGKGPRLSARLGRADAALAGAARAPALLRPAPEAALRLALTHPDAPVVTDGAALAARLRAVLGRERVALRPAAAFDEAVEAEFATLLEHSVPLPGGGRLLVHPTPALVAMDVDAGAHAGARDAAAQLRMNAAAMAEAARQIRLRNLAGAILLDPAGLAVRRREALLEPLAAALAADPLAPRLLGLTRLGLIEIVRSRVQPPLHDVLGLPPSALTHGLAALRRATREASLAPGRRLALHAAPAVLGALRALPDALSTYAQGAGHDLALQADPLRAPGEEMVAPAA